MINKSPFLLYLIAILGPKVIWASSCPADAVKVQRLNWDRNMTNEGPVPYGQGLLLKLKDSISASELKWSFDAPAIKDYDERIADNLGAHDEPSAFTAFEILPEDLQERSLTIYFKPSSKPAPDVRKISLQYRPTSSQEPCIHPLEFVLKPAESPVDLYTSDHACDQVKCQDDTPTPRGRVIKDHFAWHSMHRLTYNLHKYPTFLQWHHFYVERYNTWRKLFGYDDLELSLLKPGESINESELYVKKLNSILVWNTFTWPDSPVESLNDSFDDFESVIIGKHDQIHQQLQECKPASSFGCFSGTSSPKSQLFWRFHFYLDKAFYLKKCEASNPKPTPCLFN